MAMPSIGDLIAAKVGSHYASMQDQQSDFAEKARLRQLEQSIRDSAANAPQQTQFAEPQAQQPTTLSGLMQGYQVQANPNVTPITQSAVSPERAVFETLRRQDPIRAQEYAGKVITNAHNIAVTGDHAGAVDYVNNSLGTSLKYMGTKDNYMTIDNGDGTKTLYDLESKQSTTFGTPKPTIVNEGAAISDGKGGWTIPAPKAEKPEYKQRERTDGDKTVFEESQDGGKTWKKVSEGKRYKPASGGGQGDTGGLDDAATWGKAIMEGRANLQDVPSRGKVRSEVVKWIEKQGGTDYAGNKAENSAYSSTLTQQTKQAGSMGSFVKNLDAQIGRVGQIGAELSTFDTRLANMPLRYVRKTIMGTPEQSKYEMYLAEIESEIGKLSSGSTGSVAELSQGARQKWEKIIDPNISINGMLNILKEVKHAGELRMKSVTDQINETKAARQNRGKQPGANTPVVTKGGFKVTRVP